MKVNVELNREELATVQESLLILSAIAAAKDETATQYDAKRLEVKWPLLSWRRSTGAMRMRRAGVRMCGNESGGL
mgnify:CR=1 FL=1